MVNTLEPLPRPSVDTSTTPILRVIVNSVNTLLETVSTTISTSPTTPDGEISVSLYVLYIKFETKLTFQLCYTVFNILVLLVAARFLKWSKR